MRTGIGSHPTRWLLAAVTCALMAASSASALSLPSRPAAFPSPCASLQVVTHVVPLGGTIHAKVGPGAGQPCELGHLGHLGWRWYAGGQPVAGCANTTSSCALPARKLSTRWTTVCVFGTEGSGPVNACDYVWVVPKGIHDLSGTVEKGVLPADTGVAGVRVTAHGPGGTSSATTDAKGNYAFAVGTGRFTVTVAHLTTPAARSVIVRGDTTGVDFRLGRTLRLKGEITKIGRHTAADTPFTLVFLSRGKRVGGTVHPVTCSGLALSFIQCSGGPMRVTGVDETFWLFSIEWRRNPEPSSATGTLADGPAAADPTVQPEPKSLGTMAVGAGINFGDRVGHQFPVTIELL